MLRDDVFQQTLRFYLEPIWPYLEDPAVTEVMINGSQEIFIEKAGQLRRTEAHFRDEAALLAAVRNIAQFAGRRIHADSPRMDARLPDGSRVHAVIPPCARAGTYVSIRRFSKEKLTVDKLVAFGSLTEPAREFLQLIVMLEKNVLVSGGTGSGKTSLLNAISSMIPDGDRILVIEDSTELQLQKSHVVQMEAKSPDRHGRGRVAIRDLFHSCLRMRPDRIIIGEIRGEEALDLVQALSSGHGGSMSTLHSNTPLDTLQRLETMALLSGVELPLFALRAQIASSVQMVVHVSRFGDGSRKVTNITEVLPLGEGSRYQLQDIFEYRETGRDGDGRVVGCLTWTGLRPTFARAPVNKGLAGMVERTREIWDLAPAGERAPHEVAHD